MEWHLASLIVGALVGCSLTTVAAGLVALGIKVGLGLERRGRGRAAKASKRDERAPKSAKSAPVPTAVTVPAAASPYIEVQQALQSLKFSKLEIDYAVSELRRLNAVGTVEQLIARALRSLASKKTGERALRAVS